MKRRWLPVVGVSFLLGGCAELPTCAAPGVESPNTCNYQLMITEVLDQKTGLVKGLVDPAVVEENRTRWGIPDFGEGKYSPFQYIFNVKDLDTAPEFKNGVKNKTFKLENVPNSTYLKLKK